MWAHELWVSLKKQVSVQCVCDYHGKRGRESVRSLADNKRNNSAVIHKKPVMFSCGGGLWHSYWRISSLRYSVHQDKKEMEVCMKVWKNQDFSTNSKSQSQRQNSSWKCSLRNDWFIPFYFSTQSHWKEPSDYNRCSLWLTSFKCSPIYSKSESN